MRQLIRGGKLLTRVIARDQRKQLIEVEHQLNELTKLVDDFYALLGPRNWVFHDSLSTTDVKALLHLTPDAAERQFIALYSMESLRRYARHLNRHDALRIRMPLTELALQDHEAGRYYSTVFVLISVMDGFVNDFEQGQRRGLHARDADEMVAWDSVVGHHLGLAHAHRTFTKSTSKTSTDELAELQRNGIMHGTLLNFNNVVVATKAWNRLFAVADWATSREKQLVEPPKQPTFRELLVTIRTTEAAKKSMATWRPSVLLSDDPDLAADTVQTATATYLDAWVAKNFGAMASTLSSLVAHNSVGKTAGLVREECNDQTLDRYEIVRLSHEAPAVVEVDVTLTLNGVAKPARLRWIRERNDGSPAAPNEQGVWKLVTWGPYAMLNRAKPES